jgi:hypothetical protein
MPKRPLLDNMLEINRLRSDREGETMVRYFGQTIIRLKVERYFEDGRKLDPIQN